MALKRGPCRVDPEAGRVETAWTERVTAHVLPLSGSVKTVGRVAVCLARRCLTRPATCGCGDSRRRACHVAGSRHGDQ